MESEEIKKNKILEALERPLNTISFTNEQLQMVHDLLEPMDIQPFSGAKADAVVKALANKYYPYCKDSVKFPVLLNILYAIIAARKCDVSYVVSAAVDEAQQMRLSHNNRYPLEFYLSETLDCVTSAPDKFKVFSKDDETSEFTLKSAIEGIIGRELIFPTDTNRVVAFPETNQYLLYVTGSKRWLAVIAGDIAGNIMSYNNPVTYTNKGLVQGETLLRFFNGRNGVVEDDYVIM